MNEANEWLLRKVIRDQTKQGFHPYFLAFSSNNTAVAVSGDINSNETNKCFLAKTTGKEAI